MNFRRPALLVALLAGAWPAAAQWVRVTTPHFELLTSAGEKRGREVILYFERVRGFFLEINPSRRLPSFPVRVIVFKGEKQYKPYRFNEFATAYYVGSHDRDYIVMQEGLPEDYPVATHEYTHLIIRHAGLKLPVWMDEGVADLFSTLKPYAGKVAVGALSPGRVATMKTHSWIPLRALENVGHDSPLYNERDKASVFYAESWLLVHMLFLGEKYAPHFGAFLRAVDSGKSLPEASQSALGVSIDDLERDLHSYLSGRTLYAKLFNVKLEKSAEEPAVSDLPPFETDLALADLLVLTKKPDQAREVYERLAPENPGRPEIEESLGYLAWHNRDARGAQDHFRKAFSLGSRNAQMCFHYGMLAQASGDHDQAIAALGRALELKPDYTEARMRLGTAFMAKQDYAAALDAFRSIHNVSSEQAEWFFGAVAFTYWKTGDLAKAREHGELAQKYARTPDQKLKAAQFLEFLDSVEKQRAAAKQPAAGTSELAPAVLAIGADSRPSLKHRTEPPVSEAQAQGNPPAEARGTAQNLDCRGKTARLTILTSSGNMTFDIPNPDAVVIKNSSGGVRDLTCGPQHGYRVVVGYLKAEQPGETAGILRTLEF